MRHQVWISKEHSKAIRTAVAEVLRVRFSMIGRQRVPPAIRQSLNQLEEAERQVAPVRSALPPSGGWFRRLWSRHAGRCGA